jgi:hypothetical protein
MIGPISIWQVAVGLALVGLLGWGIWKIGAVLRQSGRDDQAAKDAQQELAERKAADAKTQNAADEFAKKGGAEDALKKGEF